MGRIGGVCLFISGINPEYLKKCNISTSLLWLFNVYIVTLYHATTSQNINHCHFGHSNVIHLCGE